MQIWNHSPPDHPIRLWVTTRCTAEGETFGKFQLKSIRLSFTVIFPVCSFLFAPFWSSICLSLKSFLSSVRIRKEFGLVIGGRLYKTRWRLLPAHYPALNTSLSHSLLLPKLRCSVPLRHSPSASHTPTLHPASL